jgi:hypothetical protein
MKAATGAALGSSKKAQRFMEVWCSDETGTADALVFLEQGKA